MANSGFTYNFQAWKFMKTPFQEKTHTCEFVFTGLLFKFIWRFLGKNFARSRGLWASGRVRWMIGILRLRVKEAACRLSPRKEPIIGALAFVYGNRVNMALLGYLLAAHRAEYPPPAPYLSGLLNKLFP